LTQVSNLRQVLRKSINNFFFKRKKHFMKNKFKTNEIPIGVVGLGLMGCSITTCLLMAGHPVVAVAPLPIDLDNAEKRIRHHLQKSLEEGLVTQQPEAYFKHYYH
jgi:3-hydroxybutyryl-CoA dehydrogenase